MDSLAKIQLTFFFFSSCDLLDIYLHFSTMDIIVKMVNARYAKYISHFCFRCHYSVNTLTYYHDTHFSVTTAVTIRCGTRTMTTLHHGKNSSIFRFRPSVNES